jgi:CBS domain-containing protein
MFSVHGVTGQTFRGTLEQLATVPGITGARASRGIALQGEELGAEIPRVSRRPGSAASTYEAAARAYRDMLRVEPERGPLYHAYQIMSRDMLSLAAWTPVDQAWQLLAERRLRQAPVLDDNEQLVGLITREDLLTALNLEAGQPRDVLDRSVAQVMASPVVSADPVTDIRRIARVMLDFGQVAVPVVNEAGLLVGLVSRGDILRAVTAEPPLSLWG